VGGPAPGAGNRRVSGAKPSPRWLDRLTGWQGARPRTRARLLAGLCAAVNPRSLVSNSVTLAILAGLIIADTRSGLQAAWVLVVILAGLLPRLYAARLRRAGEFERDTDRKALGFLAVSAVYGMIWGIGPFLMLPTLSGPSLGIFLFIMVFGTIMGPYAAMPGILYVRLATTGTATLVAVALYADPVVTLACVVIAAWLMLRTDVWRRYHRTLRRQVELQEDLEGLFEDSKAHNRELREIADTDPLTGAANRRAVMRLLEALRPPAALLVIDIDHFKRINDTYGHHVGDAVLVELVRVIQAGLREQDVLARIGGEEFVVLMTQTARYSAQALAQRLHGSIRDNPVKVGGRDIRLSISVGVAAMPPVSALTGAELLKQADAALYEAKRKGRDRVESAPQRRPVPFGGPVT